MHESTRIGGGAVTTAVEEPTVDPRLCAAIIDRLTFAGNILETGTTSYRLAHARSATAH